MGGGGRVGARQDGNDSGGKTAATEASVAERAWIGSGGRVVAGQHRVGSNRCERSAAAATAEAQAWLFSLSFDGLTDGLTDRRTDGPADRRTD